MLSFDFCEFENMGINAEVNVPSPSILRNRLGRVNASKNASPITDVPKMEKNKISLTKPNSLDNKVVPLTTEKFLKRLN